MSNYTAPNSSVEAPNGTTYASRRLGETDSIPIVFLRHFRGNLDNWDPALGNDIAGRWKDASESLMVHTKD